MKIPPVTEYIPDLYEGYKSLKAAGSYKNTYASFNPFTGMGTSMSNRVPVMIASTLAVDSRVVYPDDIKLSLKARPQMPSAAYESYRHSVMDDRYRINITFSHARLIGEWKDHARKERCAEYQFDWWIDMDIMDPDRDDGAFAGEVVEYVNQFMMNTLNQAISKANLAVRRDSMPIHHLSPVITAALDDAGSNPSLISRINGLYESKKFSEAKLSHNILIKEQEVMKMKAPTPPALAKGQGDW